MYNNRNDNIFYHGGFVIGWVTFNVTVLESLVECQFDAGVGDDAEDVGQQSSVEDQRTFVVVDGASRVADASILARFPQR